MFVKTVILSKIIFFLIKKAGSHLQYVCNNCAKFQVDWLKLWEELIIQTLYRRDGRTDEKMDGKTDGQG